MALKSGRVGIHPSQVNPITGMLIAGPGGTTDYTQLTNKPQINNVTLSGNKSLSDLGIATSFDTLSDSDINNPEAGQTLIYNGTGWENEFSSISPTTLSALQDVQITDPEVGQTLIYNGTGWENEFSSISPTTLSALQDVQITDVEDGDYLVYDATNNKWINSASAPTPVTPEGSTVLPTDDIQTWLACAAITDKTYTTLNEVLADSTTLLALMSDNNAVDYLVRSTTWASGITADSTAMTDIGANNYCANTLLDDATWCSAICNSAYFESVLNVKVPTMTSNTTPSGECGGDSYAFEPYRVFDENSSTDFDVANGGKVYYHFTSPVNVNKVKLEGWSNSAYNPTAIQLICSDDGTTWTNIGSQQTVPTLGNHEAVYWDYPSSNEQHSYWGLIAYCTVYAYCALDGIQFYGRQDV